MCYLIEGTMGSSATYRTRRMIVVDLCIGPVTELSTTGSRLIIRRILFRDRLMSSGNVVVYVILVRPWFRDLLGYLGSESAIIMINYGQPVHVEIAPSMTLPLPLAWHKHITCS